MFCCEEHCQRTFSSHVKRNNHIGAVRAQQVRKANAKEMHNYSSEEKTEQNEWVYSKLAPEHEPGTAHVYMPGIFHNETRTALRYGISMDDLYPLECDNRVASKLMRSSNRAELNMLRKRYHHGESWHFEQFFEYYGHYPEGIPRVSTIHADFKGTLVTELYNLQSVLVSGVADDCLIALNLCAYGDHANLGIRNANGNPVDILKNIQKRTTAVFGAAKRMAPKHLGVEMDTDAVKNYRNGNSSTRMQTLMLRIYTR